MKNLNNFTECRLVICLQLTVICATVAYMLSMPKCVNLQVAGLNGDWWTYQVALFQLEKLSNTLIFVHVVVVCKDAFSVYGALEGVN